MLKASDERGQAFRYEQEVYCACGVKLPDALYSTTIGGVVMTHGSFRVVER